MVKIQLKQKKETVEIEKLSKILAKDHAGYVLITCSKPDENGQMHVDLTLEGDETLTAFLIENAYTMVASEPLSLHGNV